MKILKILHKVTGLISLILILLFMGSTIYAEISGNIVLIQKVKSLIVWRGLFVLIPCLIITGAIGFKMSGQSKDVHVLKKRKRMPFIALNGIFILIPCAIYLEYLSFQMLDSTFYSVQTLELCAGLINCILIILNIRDGIRINKIKKSLLS